MLLIRTYLAPSPISGIGLFTAEDIPKGKMIWDYFPPIDITFSPEEWNELSVNLSTPSFAMIRNYVYKENGKYILCTDNAQFMNHHSSSFNVVNTDDLKSMYALRNIEKDEELFCHYGDYSDADDYHRVSLKI